MNTPKVSVLMSVYNNASTVDASIRSITEQTFTDWEMILWNDASTDETLSKLLDWQRRDERISVYSNDANLGLAASLNKALEKAKGEYIARMDGDDISVPERFEKQMRFLEANKQYSIVSSGCVLFDAEGEWGRRYGCEIPSKKDFLWGSPFLHPATVFRREALLSVGGYRVCKDTLRTEDYDLFMRMYAKGYTGYNVNEPLLYYFENRYLKHVRFSLRLSEVKIRYSGYKQLHLLPRALPYTVKPLLVWLIPGKLKRSLQKRKYERPKGSK